MEQIDEYSLILQWANLDTRLSKNSLLTHEEAFNILPYFFKVHPFGLTHVEFWAQPHPDAKIETKPFPNIQGEYNTCSNQTETSFFSSKMQEKRFVIVGRFLPNSDTAKLHAKIKRIRNKMHKEYQMNRGRKSGPARDWNEETEGEAAERTNT